MSKLYEAALSKADMADIIDMTNLRNPSTINISIVGTATIKCYYQQDDAWVEFYSTTVTSSVSCPIADTLKIEQVSGSSTTCSFSIDQANQGESVVRTITNHLTGGIGIISGDRVYPSGYTELDNKPLKIGMNVFPGWSTPGGGPNPSNPWAVIPPAREPLQGFYDETDQAVVDAQIQWMVNAGVDYVMIDWFFDTVTGDATSAELKPFLDHFIERYMSSTVIGKPKFMVMWAASTNAGRLTNTGFANTIAWFEQRYFTHPDYLRIDDRPAIAFLDVGTSYPQLSPTGISGVKAAINLAKTTTDLYVIAGCSSTNDYWISQVSAGATFDGVFPLNATRRNNSVTNVISTTGTNDFAELNYRAYGPKDGDLESWTGAWTSTPRAIAGTLTVFSPISAGFDSTPWNYTGNITLMKGFPSQDEFRSHLLTAREFVESHKTETQGWLIIQSWNEWGEGSVCCPTKSEGFEKLNAIKEVLSC